MTDEVNSRRLYKSDEVAAVEIVRRSKELTISGTAIGRWHRKVTEEVHSRRLYKASVQKTLYRVN